MRKWEAVLYKTLFILNQSKVLLNTIEIIDANDGEEDGAPFELLIITALHIRVLLSFQIQFGGDNLEQRVEIPFRPFIFTYSLMNHFQAILSHPQLESTTHFQFI